MDAVAAVGCTTSTSFYIVCCVIGKYLELI
jgi:hypothetical protein